MTVSVKRSGDSVKVYINGLLHFYVADKIIMIHAWNEETWWKIKIITASNSTVLEYNSLKKWKKILTLLDNG